VREQVAAFVARTGADELMVTSQIYDHQARLRSFEILAEVCQPSPLQGRGSDAWRREERGRAHCPSPGLAPLDHPLP
jgi:hypothetical protein